MKHIQPSPEEVEKVRLIFLRETGAELGDELAQQYAERLLKKRRMMAKRQAGGSIDRSDIRKSKTGSEQHICVRKEVK